MWPSRGGDASFRLLKLALIALAVAAALITPMLAQGDSSESTSRPYTAGLFAPGQTTTCAIVSGGSVRCWGNNGFGQLGVDSTTSIGGTVNSMMSIQNVNLGQAAVQVSSSNFSSCAILADGSVKCWGNGGDGQLGYDSSNNVGDGKAGDVLMANLPAVKLGQPAVELSGGGYHMCAILLDGSVKCWGNGPGGLGTDSLANVGDGGTTSTSMAALGPINLHGHKAVAISAGGPANTPAGDTCVILDDGSVECFGVNTYGQLGYDDTDTVGENGGTEIHMAAVVPFDPGGHKAVAISTSGQHTCAIGDDGGVRCWGRGQYGQLGYDSSANVSDGAPGDVTMAALPAVDLGQKAVAVTTGDLDTCAILADGTVRCWGYGGVGQLGYDAEVDVGDGVAGHVTMANLPAVNLGGNTAIALYSGSEVTCALLSDGAVRCWGLGGNGQLGYNSINNVGDGVSGDTTMANLGAVPIGASIDTSSSNLSLALSPSESTASVGDALTVTLTLSNGGPDDSTSSTIGVTLPSGLSLTSAAPSQGIYQSSPGWQPGALASGASATLTLHVTVTATGSLTPSAQITAAAPAGPLIGANASTTITSGSGTGTTTTTTTPTTTTPTTTKPTTTKPTTTTPVNTPKPGALRIGASVKVSSKRVAGLSLSCAGKSGATCTGKLTLTVAAKKKVQRKLHGHTKTVTVTTTVTLGSASYSLPAGGSTTLRIKLSKAAVKLLDAAHNRKLSVRASAKPSHGSTVTRVVALTGPPPPPKA